MGRYSDDFIRIQSLNKSHLNTVYRVFIIFASFRINILIWDYLKKILLDIFYGSKDF